MSFAKRLGDAIAARGLKATECAVAIGKSKAYLSLLLSGKRGEPRDYVVERLAAVLHVSKDWLLTGVDDAGSASSLVNQNQPSVVNPADISKMLDAELVRGLQRLSVEIAGDVYKQAAIATLLISYAEELRRRANSRISGSLMSHGERRQQA